MARRQRSSSTLEAATHRLAGLTTITPVPDFGSGLTLAAYSGLIDDLSVKLNNYNKSVTTTDELLNQVESAEQALGEFSRRILAAAEAHYGPDSNQYQQAGGTRTRDRRRIPKKETKKGLPGTAGA